MPNMFMLSGIVKDRPTLSERGKVGHMYIRCLVPAKNSKKSMTLRAVSFSKTAIRMREQLREGMRVVLFGQINIGMYPDKRLVRRGVPEKEANTIVIQLVIRDFWYNSSQLYADRLQIAMDLASADDWEEKSDTEGDVGV